MRWADFLEIYRMIAGDPSLSTVKKTLVDLRHASLEGVTRADVQAAVNLPKLPREVDTRLAIVTKSPVVTVNGRQMKYLISFALPRFCDQSLDRSRKERFYRRASDAWIAKLDTVIHELYHIDPQQNGIRRIERSDGTYAAHCHGPLFFEQVAEMVSEYLDSRPDPSAYDFLQHDFAALNKRHDRVVATSFRSFPSYPQRFIERLPAQPPCDASLASVDVQPWREGRRRECYSETDLHVREFTLETSRRFAVKRDRAA